MYPVIRSTGPRPLDWGWEAGAAVEGLGTGGESKMDSSPVSKFELLLLPPELEEDAGVCRCCWAAGEDADDPERKSMSETTLAELPSSFPPEIDFGG